MTIRKNFPIYRNWRDSIDKLSNDEKLYFYNMIAEYYFDGVIPSIPSNMIRLDIFWDTIKDDVYESNEKYLTTANRRADNIRNKAIPKNPNHQQSPSDNKSSLGDNKLIAKQSQQSLGDNKITAQRQHIETETEIEIDREIDRETGIETGIEIDREIENSYHMDSHLKLWSIGYVHRCITFTLSRGHVCTVSVVQHHSLPLAPQKG